MKDNYKLLVIMGSPHKGNTYRACEDLKELILREIPAEFEYLWLEDANLLPCKGCLVCFTHGEDKCPNQDDGPLIEKKICESDGVIFATPVYGMNVTGQMKIFIDRFSYIFHRPRFFDKKALLVTTAGVLGHKDVLKYLNTVAGIWGFEITGKVGLITPIPLPDHRKEENMRAISKAAGEFAGALKRRQRKSPKLSDIMVFHGQRAAFSQLMTESPADYKYWKEKGWLDKGVKYFVDLPINPLYHLIGVLIEWFARRKVRKDLVHKPG